MSLLSNEDKRFLLRLARASLEAAVLGKRFPEPEEVVSSLRDPGSAFVTLRSRQQLRGCVGFIEGGEPLYQVIMAGAAAAALRDVRFLPVAPAETSELQIEISVLSPPRPASAEEIVAGVHGVIVTHGRARGLLLPQVAEEQNWTALQLLEQTCRKAGLAPTAWQSGARVEIFTADVFCEETLG